MLILSPRKIVGIILFCFLALLGIRHYFHVLKQTDPDLFGYYIEQQFDKSLPLFAWLDRTDYDVHLRAQKLGVPHPDIAVIEINERSIQALGQFPFARSVYITLIEKLESYGAKVVAFDMAFSEPERNETLSELRSLKNDLKSEGPSVLEAIDGHIGALDNDNKFARVIKSEKTPVVVGFMFVGQHDLAQDLPPSTKAMLQKNHSISTSQVNQSNFGSPMSGRVPVVPNLDILSALPKGGLGHVTPDPDTDSVIRNIPITVEYGGAFYISLAMQAVAKYLKITPVLERDSGGLWMRSREGKINVPLNESGGMFARFYGDKKKFPFIEFSDVIQNKVKDPEKTFRGKIIFVGATAIGLKDIRATPFSENYPGVEVHATLASNMLSNYFMVKDQRYFQVGYFLLLALGLLSWVVYRYHPAVASFVCFIAIAAVQLAAQKFFFDQGVVVPTFLPCLELITLLFTGILYRYFTEEKEKKFVRTAFSRYVSGAVVEELLKDQSKLQLGGQKKELTVMFSDLAGFTKLSEHLDAGFVTQLLNEYFTRMTEIILRNHGTLDKYMGDGIMCFWGAPLDLPDHPIHACRAAAEMTQELEKLNSEWQAKHNINLGMRIGVHTGDMAVGNMGSDKVFSYTVMGDNVNLCSRLEGVNSVYGTTIIVSEQTAARVGEQFVLRPLDIVKVKGKEDQVKVFELLGPAGMAAPGAEWLHAFSSGLEAYQAGRWEEASASFGAVLALKPGDGPAKVFLSRIQELQKEHPSHWDGVWKLSSK